MKFVKAFIAKLVAKIKSEPAVTAGGVAGAVAAVVTWAQTNQITTVRQLVTFGAPIVLAYVIRTFVVPNGTAKLLIAQLGAIELKLAQVKEAVAPAGPTIELSKLLAQADAAHVAGDPVTGAPTTSAANTPPQTPAT